ncbi:MAG: hypothetical protein NDJ89_17275 [Oligoflexia bacterium]|nr:hypothetical protein [Oligoflexia bacterium]
MTTFQTFIYALIHGFAGLLPISAQTHDAFVAELLGWPLPTGQLAGALSLGAFLAVLVHFRHDWASMISCFLQVLIYRKRPMTLDERLPFFLFISTAPVAAGWYYFHERIAGFPLTLLQLAGLFAAFALPLWLSEALGRKNKGMFDWNWLDALIVGIFQLGALLPGCGQMAGALPGALLRNYRREAAAKYAFFAAAPLLGAAAYVELRGLDLRASAPMPELSWLSFTVAVLVTLFAGLLAIGGFMRQMQRKSSAQYIVYRWLLAAAMTGVYWWRSRQTG